MRARLAGGATSPRDEAGMTLVEVMVAMLILTVVFSALASVLTTSLHSLHGQENRVKANALANELLEELQDLDWDEVGFSQVEDDSHDYREYVNVGSGEPCGEEDVDDESQECEATVTFEKEGLAVPDDPRPRPVRNVERDGTEYEVRTDVTWVDDPQTASNKDYKRFRVHLTWRDFGLERSVTHAAARTPSPDEQAAADLAVRSFVLDPTLGYLHSPGASEERKVTTAVRYDDDGNPYEESFSPNGVTMSLRTTAPVHQVDVWITDYTDPDNPAKDTISMQEVGEQDGTEWELGRGDTNTWRYRNGDVTFTFEVYQQQGDTEPAITTRKNVRYVFEQVEFRDDIAAPDVVCVDDDNVVSQEVLVEMHVHGLTVDDHVEVGGPNLPAGSEADHEGSSNAGSNLSFTLEEGHQLPETVEVGGQIELQFDAKRLFDLEIDGGNGTATETVVLNVEDAEGSACS